MTTQTKLVEIYISVKRRTDLAILVHIEDKELWIPKSLIKNFDDVEINVHFMGHIEIPEWFAYEKELI